MNEVFGYTSPEVKVVSVVVEKGFAASVEFGGGGLIPTDEDEE